MEGEFAASMTPYEDERWKELCDYWNRRGRLRQSVPKKVRDAGFRASEFAQENAARAYHWMSDHTPDSIFKMADAVGDKMLGPALEALNSLLELVTELVETAMNPETVISFHQSKGRPVTNLSDIQALTLDEIDEYGSHGVLIWRLAGAGEGAAAGALAMIPVPVVGSAAAISVDALLVHALTTAAAVEACHMYGYDIRDAKVAQLVRSMVSRAYVQQTGKSQTFKRAHDAWRVSKGRERWSKRLAQDHRLLEAMRKLLEALGPGGRVPVKSARMGVPVVSIITGSGINSWILGQTAKEARIYAATHLLSKKYGLPLPSKLKTDEVPPEAD